jgi:hypothetical protein
MQQRTCERWSWWKDVSWLCCECCKSVCCVRVCYKPSATSSILHNRRSAFCGWLAPEEEEDKIAGDYIVLHIVIQWSGRQKNKIVFKHLYCSNVCAALKSSRFVFVSPLNPVSLKGLHRPHFMAPSLSWGNITQIAVHRKRFMREDLTIQDPSGQVEFISYFQQHT